MVRGNRLFRGTKSDSASNLLDRLELLQRHLRRRHSQPPLFVPWQLTSRQLPSCRVPPASRVPTLSQPAAMQS
uniref:Uncharacterized protein n=1 Tax=Macrostomum lignano TaxID=282301 RepID=A0A1I8G050_9PLAT